MKLLQLDGILYVGNPDDVREAMIAMSKLTSVTTNWESGCETAYYENTGGLRINNFNEEIFPNAKEAKQHQLYNKFLKEQKPE